MYVRQHYKLATTGQLGQKLQGSGGKAPTGGKGKTMSRVGSRSGGYGGKGKTQA